MCLAPLLGSDCHCHHDDDHDDHGDDDDAAKMIGATKYVKADKADEGIWFVFVFAFVTL